ncbi:MAG: hypothetical protein KTR22_05495 [Flavobacteriaceae bacterium]|nr:hypothetical protein [Flavobacteriaceae bacterium]
MTYRIQYIVWLCIAIIVGSCSEDDSGSIQEDPAAGIELTVQDLTITMDENPEEGMSIGQLVAESNIENEFQFLIEFADFPEAITLVRETGEILVNDPSEFNYELNETLEFGIRVSVRARIRRATITINITNIAFEGEFPGRVELKSQEQVDFFGRNRYESVARRLIIGGEVPEGETPITNLLALRDLRSVGDGFIIENADELPTLEGLDDFELAGKEMVIEDNDMLNSIAALDNVTVSWSFEIVQNGQLVELVIPENLSVGNDLVIAQNNDLTSILGGANTGQIEGLSIRLNPFLTNIDAFGDRETMSRDLIILNNPNLVDLDFLTQLREVQGSLTFNKNPSASLIHLPNLETVQGDFSILTNSSLTSITGLSGLNFVGGNFHVRQNSSLSDFCAFTPFIENGTIGQEYLIIGNAYNPTQQDILEGNCSL